MNALTLQWYDAGQNKTQKIFEQQPSKNPGTVRIGRDPVRCDIVLTHPTVSGLHVEIYFQPQHKRFYIRNLRGEQNPPLIDGKQLIQGELPLNEGSIIYLGQMHLKVIAISITASNSVPETVLAPPQPPARQNPQTPTKPPIQKQKQQQYQHSYGLQCPNCGRVSTPEHLQVGCPWCGTSLAAAVSVLMPPN